MSLQGFSECSGSLSGDTHANSFISWPSLALHIKHWNLCCLFCFASGNGGIMSLAKSLYSIEVVFFLVSCLFSHPPLHVSNFCGQWTLPKHCASQPAPPQVLLYCINMFLMGEVQPLWSRFLLAVPNTQFMLSTSMGKKACEKIPQEKAFPEER